MEEVGGAVLVGGSASFGVEPEDLVFQRLDGFKDLVDTRIEAPRARGEFLSRGTDEAARMTEAMLRTRRISERLNIPR